MFLNFHQSTKTLAEHSLLFMKGLGFMGSCVAIHNMVLVETTFHHDFLQGFNPAFK
jgi:hypothetical protein